MATNGSSFIFVNSADRLYGNSSNFTVNINDSLPNAEKDLSLNYLSINKSWYPINSNNNTFTLLGATGQAVPYTATLLNGVYNATTFIAEMNTVLDALGVSGSTFTPAYSSSTGKMTITSSNLTEFSIVSNTKNNRYLGMSPSTTVSSASGVWTSPNVIDLAGSAFVDVYTNLPLASVNTRNIDHGLLVRVYPTASQFEQIVYTKADFNYIRLLTDRLNQITFTLRDDNGDILDLNGTEWACTLEYRTLPK